MSSGLEANLHLRLKVIFDNIRHLIDVARVRQPSIKIVDIVPMSKSSYSTQKLIIKLLVNNYSHRSLINEGVVYLSTVFVQAGAPTATASSFVSRKVHELVNR